MSKPSICCVVPSIRQSHMEEFRKAWAPLFEKHAVTLITVWDGEHPEITVNDRSYGEKQVNSPVKWTLESEYRDLICRRTDAVRNLGFAFVAGTCHGDADYILTLDDDVYPPAGSDPIQEHLDVLQRRVPISWMNTAMDTIITDWSMHTERTGGERKITHMSRTTIPTPYLRGFPYGIRDEAQVMVSHGVWVNVPDFDGRTQLELTNNGRNPERLPYSLPYFRGPVPKGTYFPFCGMNVMVRKEALPYLYFAPMGPDSGVLDSPQCDCGDKWPLHSTERAKCIDCGKEMVGGSSPLNRFADIWCGILLKRACDSNGWAIYTGASTVIHTRASDPFKNVEQERLGIEWNEWAWRQYGPEYPNSYPKLSGTDSKSHTEFRNYWRSYLDKAARFRDLIRKLQGAV